MKGLDQSNGMARPVKKNPGPRMLYVLHRLRPADVCLPLPRLAEPQRIDRYIPVLQDNGDKYAYSLVYLRCSQQQLTDPFQF